MIDFYHATARNATHGIVMRMLCVKRDLWQNER